MECFGVPKNAAPNSDKGCEGEGQRKYSGDDS